MSEINLAKRAMLVCMRIRLEGLLGERRDRDASSLVTSTYDVAETRAKASKFLINRKHTSVKGVIAAAQQVRAVVYRYTFPWGETALRLLPAKAYPEFKGKLDEAMKNLAEALDRYYTFYPYLVTQSEQELGRLFDATQYPDLERIKQMFKISVGYLPMPESGHFIADIANDAAEAARDTIIAQTREATHDAFYDMAERVQRTVQTLVDSLGAFKPKKERNDKIEGIFRDSLIANVSDIAGLISTLNFTDDPRIEKIARETRRLSQFSAEYLRTNASVRSKIIQDGQALLQQLEMIKKVDEEVDTIISDMAPYT